MICEYKGAWRAFEGYKARSNGTLPYDFTASNLASKIGSESAPIFPGKKHNLYKQKRALFSMILPSENGFFLKP